MKIVSINTLPTGSPATIMRGILEVAEKEIGAESISYYGNWGNSPPKYKGSKRFGFKYENYLASIFERLTGIFGYGSVLGTIILLNEIDKFHPDIIHLHNLHLSVINLPLLFRYIKKNNIKTIWTLHDCWAFTGRCPHFQISKCDKWKNLCHNCPYPHNEYPRSYLDNTRLMYEKKKKWFLGINEMRLVTPSKWLARLVKESFLSEYPVEVIHNGVDLSVFQPSSINCTRLFWNNTNFE